MAWSCAIVATTLQLSMAVANLVLVGVWHGKYKDDSTDAFAATRDVARRCHGAWNFDLVWDAAKSSLSSDETQRCTPAGLAGVHLFLMAGGVRLAVMAVLLTLWLLALGRYIYSMDRRQEGPLDAAESAEMHRLLEEEMNNGPNAPGYFFEHEKTLTNPELRLYADFVEERPSAVDSKEFDLGDAHRAYSMDTMTTAADRFMDSQSHRKSSDLAPLVALGNAPPRLQRFRWQRGEASTVGVEYHSVPLGEELRQQEKREQEQQHEQESEPSLLAKVWDSLWGMTAHPHTDLQRNGSRLGVSGWFAREPTTGEHTPGDGISRSTSTQGVDAEKQDDATHFCRPSRSDAPAHERTLSQERRAQEGRHAASAQVLRSRSNGDELPHMPELMPVTVTEHDRHRQFSVNSFGSDDSAGSLTSSVLEAMQHEASNTPQYVRHMGKLVHKLSAIESVGSAERERDASTHSSMQAPSIASSLNPSSASAHAKRPSWNASSGTRAHLQATQESTDEEEDASPRSAGLLAPPTPTKSGRSSRSPAARARETLSRVDSLGRDESFTRTLLCLII